MAATDPFEALDRDHEQQQQRMRRLARLAHQWDNVVREGLQHLARALWPQDRVLGLIPVHHYRLRHRLEPERYVWWVERDIPPADLYQCAAYRVHLTLDGENEAMLTVESGTTTYPVTPPSQESLNQVLARAGADTPLVIAREMGEATDP